VRATAGGHQDGHSALDGCDDRGGGALGIEPVGDLAALLHADDSCVQVVLPLVDELSGHSLRRGSAAAQFGDQRPEGAADALLLVAEDDGVTPGPPGGPGGQLTEVRLLVFQHSRGPVIGHGEQLRPAAREVVEELSLPNSIKICYPVFRDHIPTRAALLARSAEIFTLIETGQLKVNIGRRYPLAEAAQAHLDIESRATTGKLLLLPSCSPQPWCER
jgi:hypothetical protein